VEGGRGHWSDIPLVAELAAKYFPAQAGKSGKKDLKKIAKKRKQVSIRSSGNHKLPKNKPAKKNFNRTKPWQRTAVLLKPRLSHPNLSPKYRAAAARPKTKYKCRTW